MATPIWRSTSSLRSSLQSTPEKFDFYQAVRLLQHARPDRPAVAESAQCNAEAITFKSDNAFAFAPAEIKSLETPNSAKEPVEMTVRHLSLAGAFGPLPAAFGERLLEASRAGDQQFLAFLDMFHHRLVSLFFKAKQRSRPALRQKAPWNQPMATAMLALLGLGTPGLQGRIGVPDRSLLGHAGLLVGPVRSAHALKQLVTRHFGVNVRVRENIGAWCALDANQTTKLGGRGRNTKLGQSTVLGKRVWNQSAGIELVLGPLDTKSMTDLLPNGSKHDALKALAKFGTNNKFAIKLTLIPAAKSTTQFCLGTSRLSYETWLGDPTKINRNGSAVRIRRNMERNPSFAVNETAGAVA